MDLSDDSVPKQIAENVSNNPRDGEGDWARHSKPTEHTVATDSPHASKCYGPAPAGAVFLCSGSWRGNQRAAVARPCAWWLCCWGTTAFSVAHAFSEYQIMIRFSRWDTPPGFGYVTAAVITISAILTAIRTPTRATETGGGRAASG